MNSVNRVTPGFFKEDVNGDRSKFRLDRNQIINKGIAMELNAKYCQLSLIF